MLDPLRLSTDNKTGDWEAKLVELQEELRRRDEACSGMVLSHPGFASGIGTV